MNRRHALRTIPFALAVSAMALVGLPEGAFAQAKRSITVTAVSSFKLVEPLIQDFVKESESKSICRCCHTRRFARNRWRTS